MATSAAASPIFPDHISSPVVGSIETRVPLPGRSVTRSCSLSCWCIPLHCLAHAANCLNLVLERLPVVAFGDGGPDCLDLVNVHRARLGVGPIWVRLATFATLERFRQLAERLGGIELLAWIVAAAPVEKNAVDGRRAGRKRV